jgi:hypothetical protein
VIAPRTVGLYPDVACVCGRLAMTRSEAHRRARAWRRLWLRMVPYDCPICGYFHIAKRVR